MHKFLYKKPVQLKLRNRPSKLKKLLEPRKTLLFVDKKLLPLMFFEF